MDYLIREGQVNDLPLVLELIMELVKIKKQEDEVSITIYDLIKDGFSINPLFKIFVAEKNKNIVGFSLFYKSYSTNGRSLILEEVFVSKKFKKSGIGLSLFAKFLDYAKKNKIYRLEWDILIQYKGLIELYERAGAKVLKDTRVFTMNEKTIDNVLKKKPKVNKNILFEQIAIRDGESKDMLGVLELFKELTIYKNSTCDIDVYDLIRDGFSNQPLFKTIVLEINHEIVGVLLFYHSYSILKGKSLIIEDLHLKNEYRHYGFGEALNYKLFEYAKKNHKKRISQAIFDFDKSSVERCLAVGAKKIKGLRIVQIDSTTLNKFINKD